MQYITDEMIDQIIDQMESEFDTHDFIQELMRQSPQAYTRELYDLRFYRDPFLVLHPNIAKTLLRNERVSRLRMTRTQNIRGRETPNRSWRRI